MNSAWLIALALVVGGGLVYAKTKIEKKDTGFVFTNDTVHTYYMNRILWGDTYTDHKNNAPVHNTEVIAFGDGWEYSTTTDDDGVFKVEVRPNSVFKIKASDGNSWSVSGVQDGVKEGTTRNEVSK